MKLLRWILFPFSILYGCITSLRNYFYNKGWLSSQEYDFPVICVGNLSVGGTGKSPMIEYLISFLKDDYKIAVLSRGYKRKTSGFKEVHGASTAEEVGDEPLQFKQNFPNCVVAVCEDRKTGIANLRKKADVILLDDAFQHRKVSPNFSILLTSFHELYIEDFMLPTGNLRESRAGARRADLIVVTKCPDVVSYAKLQEIKFRLQPQPHQKVYFSKIGYDDMIYGKTENLRLQYLQDKPFTLVTGIANPKPLLDYLKRNQFTFKHEKFPDHHEFSPSEINNLKQKELILTTEKDYMRLQPKLDKFALYYLPIKTLILNEQEEFFQETVRAAIKKKIGKS
ncbi:tetraacyldisaccharide 4'-kinase [Constantimarinum furrinae]|uniref:Tetraacyldisaccharide 4'-kinase n=1 Tax=Constantimarinum furrinae TaxID=2562285 RepID=A0A7G8PR83_9FLAO|nr:tetraacyldisaccharide 4'-kinase [Constantimarinum furrinae]QNJ96849.1 Tetraacyldisaccharide 4'-kinase [Constantimarinum furrinae]